MSSHRPVFHTDTTGRPVLEVDRVSVEYSGGIGKPVFRAVNEVSVAVWPGESLGLVGESGCGKTSLGRAVVGLAPISTGTLSLRQPPGGDGGAFGRRLARAVQMVFQDPYSSLDPRQRVRDAVAEPMLVHKVGTTAERAERAAHLLDLVGLDGRAAGAYPHELSGGQRQRVCIARALAVSPQLLVCDEPTSALDVSIQAQVVALLKQLQRDEQLTYLFISHDLALLPQLVTDVAVMYLGRIVEHGPVADVLRRPRHPYTVSLIEAVPELGRRREHSGAGLLRGEATVGADTTGCRFRPRCWLHSQLDEAQRAQCVAAVPELAPRPRNGHVTACHHVEQPESSHGTPVSLGERA